MPVAYGWDASDFDWDRGPMDLGSAVRDGISFFTHKATEGTRVKHAYYREALRRARDAGMPVYGAYIVVRTPGNGGHGSVDAQVRYFLAYLDSETPWWRADSRFRIGQVDTEHWGYDDVAPRYGAEACALLRSYAPKLWVPHYAPAWAYGNSIPGPDPLWASAYGTNPAVPYRQAYPGDRAWPAPYSGRTPAIWQYGSRTTIGRQPTCDANVIRDPAVWAAITGGDDMSQAAEESIGRIEAMVKWIDPRVEALTHGYETVRFGPETGAPVEAAQRIKALETKVASIQAGGAPTQEQVDAAMLAAMQDPGVQAGIGAAIASHLHVT